MGVAWWEGGTRGVVRGSAVRETLEETGYEVVIERMVGEYRRPHHPEGGDVMRVYVGRVVGGGPEHRGWEAVAVQWFPVERLPRRLSPLAREHIRDARANKVPVYKEQHIPLAWRLLGRAALWWRKRRRGR